MKNKYVIILIALCMVTLRIYSVNHIIIDSIVIKQAPWHIMTPSDVTCSNFENDIYYNEYHISDSSVITDIVREINSLKPSNGKSLNVRCKLYFYSHGQVFSSACLDPHHVLYDGALYYLSPSFKNKIDNVIKNNTPKKPINKEVFAKRDIPFPNGRDSLYTYLMSVSEEFIKKIEKPIALTVNCQIDNQGNTIKVVIRNRENTTPDENVKDLFIKLTKVFMNDIKWIPDKERFPYDFVSIPLRLEIVEIGDSIDQEIWGRF